MVRCQRIHPKTTARSANPPTIAPAIAPVVLVERPEEGLLGVDGVVLVAVVDVELDDVVEALVLVKEVVDCHLARLKRFYQ